MKLARVNTSLLVVIIVVNAFVVVAPFVPGMLFWLERAHAPTFGRLQAQIHKPIAGTTANRLIVPSMLLDQPINEGKDLRTAESGPWRLPHTSTPDKGGNTVIVGHRFTYTNPRGAFYQLDKVRAGDDIGIYWNNKKYVYRVTKTEVVPPAQISVEAPTEKPQLTLYTCTPLWWPKERLAVTATLKEPL